MGIDSKQRFSSRVENYVRYRPSYPHQVIDTLAADYGLAPRSVVADVASGTGLFTRFLLENGNRVFAVEPNAEMREAGEKYLAGFPKLTSIDGSAEATTLPDQSVDFVTAAQAAHWFHRDKARAEFVRVIKPGGWCALIWNERQTDTTPFLRAYEQLLLMYGTDYQDVRQERTTESIAEFFGPSACSAHSFVKRQEFDYTSLEGRLLSSSYAPEPGNPKHSAMLRELRAIFDEYRESGHVSFDYTTRLYCGQLA
jgi:ubiquinone/menaquinone biosynthesis C-methylase UbiE